MDPRTLVPALNIAELRLPSVRTRTCVASGGRSCWNLHVAKELGRTSLIFPFFTTDNWPFGFCQEEIFWAA